MLSENWAIIFDKFFQLFSGTSKTLVRLQVSGNIPVKKDRRNGSNRMGLVRSGLSSAAE